MRNEQLSTDTIAIMTKMYFLLMLTILGYSEGQNYYETTLPDIEVTITETVKVTDQGKIQKFL